MSINLKTFFREVVVRVVLTIAKWIIDHLDPNDEAPSDDGTG